MGIEFIDHVITREGWYSFAEEGVVNNKRRNTLKNSTLYVIVSHDQKFRR